VLTRKNKIKMGINRRWRFLLISLSSILLACENNLIYFDLNSQKIIRCSDQGIRHLEIGNDSLKSYYFIKWVSNSEAPKEISLNNIDKGYKIILNGEDVIPNTSFKLTPNVLYNINHTSSGDAGPGNLQIYISKNGVTKASKFNCK